MKKNFFKKLSFVLALAMVLSVVAPAASAFAAAGPKLNSTKKYLHLGRDNANEYNFNINNKKSGWKYLWESSNEDVVVVNEKNGVATATGVGTAKVTVFISDKKGEEVTDLTATVVVRDNIKEVSITNKPEGDKLAVGVENDFNRSFVTEANSTKKTSAITRWTVEPAEGATIADNGVFVATKAGKYTVTANSFQSKEKFNTWKKDAVANADLVLATDSYELTVSASMVSAKQVDLDTVNVSFDSAMVDVDKNIAVYQMVGTTKVKQTIKKVALDDAKKVATVDLYIPFTKGSTYVVEYTGMDSVNFVAATTNPEDVASMQITTTTAVVNEETEVKVKLFNKDNVDITTDLLKTRVTMTATNDTSTYFNTSSKKVLIFVKGVTTTVTATYHTYKYNTTTGVEEGNVTAAGVIMGVDASATNITGLNAWTIVTDGNPEFGNVKQLLAVGDDQTASPRLFVKLNTLKDTTTGDVNSKDNAGHFKFTSSDDNILIISDTGYVYPVKEGVATVVVHYGTGDTKTPVATLSITVTAKKAATNFTLDATEFSLSNTVGLGDNKGVKLTMKDQLGRAFNFSKVKVERISAPVLANGNFTADQLTTVDEYAVSSSNGEYTINFNADSKLEGVYVYKITVENISRVVSVTVLKANSTEVAYRRLELGTTSQDMKVNSWDSSFEKSVSIKLIGYSQNGVKLTDETLNKNGTNFYVEVKAPYDAANNFASDNNNAGSYKVVKTITGVSGSAIVKAPIGSYEVKAFDKDGKVVDTKYFTTTDTQAKAVLAKIENQLISTTVAQADIKNESTSATLIKVVEDALDFKVDGNAATIIEVSATGTPNSIAVKSVKVRYAIKTGFYLDYNVNVDILLQK